MAHELAARIEHTNLRATASGADIARLCAEAREHAFHAVCVHGARVARAVQELAGSPVTVCTVVGFPLGASLGAVKAEEARLAVCAGASEIDMVLALGAFLEGDDDGVVADMLAVVEATRAEGGRAVKVILETGHLDEESIRRACRLAGQAGADFVKTSTGFGPRGASVEDIRVMRDAVGDALGIKASGGIRSRADAVALVAAGADRLGTSAGIAIVGGGAS